MTLDPIDIHQIGLDWIGLDCSRLCSPCHRATLEPSLRFGNVGSDGPYMIGRERTDILSPNHMRAFRPYVSESGDWV
jgi:hypothetical protein